MDFILEHITTAWLLIGALFIFMEAMSIPGVGFLFAGLAAITVGGLTQFEVVGTEQYILQASIFLAASFLWTAILWVPFKRFYKKSKDAEFNNIVGEVAVVYSKSLVKNVEGEVKWSGAVMRAILSENSSMYEVAAGSVVRILEINGNILTVTSK